VGLRFEPVNALDEWNIADCGVQVFTQGGFEDFYYLDAGTGDLWLGRNSGLVLYFEEFIQGEDKDEPPTPAPAARRLLDDLTVVQDRRPGAMRLEHAPTVPGSRRRRRSGPGPARAARPGRSAPGSSGSSLEVEGGGQAAQGVRSQRSARALNTPAVVWAWSSDSPAAPSGAQQADAIGRR
jgi:hypothetical protein